MNSRLNHVALLVSSAEASATFLNNHGIATEDPETFDSEGTKEIYVGSNDTQSGLLLLVEAISEGPYKRALLKRGPSLHHIAIDVLDIEEFSITAQNLGWKLHPVSAETLKHHTAWFFLEGIPTLIEVHRKKTLPSKPQKISCIELPIKNEDKSLFAGIGLGSIVLQGREISLTIDGHKFSFDQIALR